MLPICLVCSYETYTLTFYELPIKMFNSLKICCYIPACQKKAWWERIIMCVEMWGLKSISGQNTTTLSPYIYFYLFFKYLLKHWYTHPSLIWVSHQYCFQVQGIGTCSADVHVPASTWQSTHTDNVPAAPFWILRAPAPDSQLEVFMSHRHWHGHPKKEPLPPVHRRLGTEASCDLRFRWVK